MLSTFQDFLRDVSGAMTAAAVAAGGTFLTLRRKYSKDSYGIAEDRAQGQLLATVMRERDNALAVAEKAWAQRTEDATTIARLDALMEAAEKETSRLRDELFAMRLHVQKITALIIRLDPQYAALLELIPGPRDGIEIPVHAYAQGPPR